MKTAVFFKLVEQRLLQAGTEIGVEYPVYQDGKKVKTVKGSYTIESIYAHPLYFAPVIRINNEIDQAEIDMKHIKSIEGETPLKFAARNGINSLGKFGELPKKRGRISKERLREAQLLM